MNDARKVNRDHSFDIELATILSVEKAIILKNVDFWCRENARRGNDAHFVDNEWWGEESLRSLAKKYPYMKRTTLARWMKELEAEGWLITMKKSGETTLYRTGIVFNAWNTHEDWNNAKAFFLLSQNGTPDCPKMGHELSQNGSGYCPKMGHTPILDIDSNVEKNGAFAPDPPKKETKNEKIKREAAEAIEYLNAKSGRVFRLVASNLKFPSGRLQEGATLEDLKLIVDCYCERWKGKSFQDGTKADDYLRPSTLFQAEKFDAYLNASKQFVAKKAVPQAGDIAAMRKAGIYNQK